MKRLEAVVWVLVANMPKRASWCYDTCLTIKMVVGIVGLEVNVGLFEVAKTSICSVLSI